MRATLANAALMRYAGRFVWLELDFDNPINQPFMASHGVSFTPTLFVLNPGDDRATATKFGGLTLSELRLFLERGERGVKEKVSGPADVALARGEEMVGRGQLKDAVTAYREALKLAPPGWPEQNRVIVLLTRTLQQTRDFQACAELTATHAPTMPRESFFAFIALAGLRCSLAGGRAPWAETARKVIEPLAVEAVTLPSTLRDDRFQIYQQFMWIAQLSGDKDKVALWGERWLKEIEATTAADDDERSALDIARVDAASLMDKPDRVLPALIASERAMPTNYSASMRVADMETAAKRYDEALAACERGLAHVTGPLGQVWIMKIKAEALLGTGDKNTARKVLEEALKVAQTIGNERLRANNVRSVTQSLAEIDKP